MVENPYIFLQVCVLCNNAQIQTAETGLGNRSPSEKSYSGSATEKALMRFGCERGGGKLRLTYQRISELPFSSDRKFMAVQCKKISNENSGQPGHCDNLKPIYFVKGAIEEVLCNCNSVLLHGKTVPLPQDLSTAIISDGQGEYML